MKPTDKQIRWLWEQCGFKWIEVKAYRAEGYWASPDGKTNYTHASSSSGFPTLDLNNLVLYAVPKLSPKTLIIETYHYEGEMYYSVYILSEKQSGGLWCGNDKNLADAMVEAIYKALGGKE